MSRFLSIDLERANAVWRLIKPSNFLLSKDDQSVNWEEFVRTFEKFARYRSAGTHREHLHRLQRPIECQLPGHQPTNEHLVCLESEFMCLQIPASVRCWYQTELFKLRDDQPARIKLEELLGGQPSTKGIDGNYSETLYDPKLSLRLANLWKETFEHETVETHGGQLTAFLELIIGGFPSEFLTPTLSYIDAGSYLRHATLDHLSNLLATHVKGCILSTENSLAGAHDFFRHVTRLQKHPIHRLFDATVNKLEREDVVLCFWLFLTDVKEGNDCTVSGRLWKIACRRMAQRPLATTVAFLARCPRKTLFDRLERAMLALVGESAWEKAWKEDNPNLYNILHDRTFWTHPHLQEEAYRADAEPEAEASLYRTYARLQEKAGTYIGMARRKVSRLVYSSTFRDISEGGLTKSDHVAVRKRSIWSNVFSF